MVSRSFSDESSSFKSKSRSISNDYMKKSESSGSNRQRPIKGSSDADLNDSRSVNTSSRVDRSIRPPISPKSVSHSRSISADDNPPNSRNKSHERRYSRSRSSSLHSNQKRFSHSPSPIKRRRYSSSADNRNNSSSPAGDSHRRSRYGDASRNKIESNENKGDLFVGGLPPDIKENELKEIFKDVKIKEVSINRQTMSGRIFAYLVLENQDEAQNIINKYDRLVYQGFVIRVDYRRINKSLNNQIDSSRMRFPPRKPNFNEYKYRATIFDVPLHLTWRDLKFVLKHLITSEFCDVTGKGTGIIAFRCHSDLTYAINKLNNMFINDPTGGEKFKMKLEDSSRVNDRDDSYDEGYRVRRPNIDRRSFNDNSNYREFNSYSSKFDNKKYMNDRERYNDNKYNRRQNDPSGRYQSDRYEDRYNNPRHDRPPFQSRGNEFNKYRDQRSNFKKYPEDINKYHDRGRFNDGRYNQERDSNYKFHNKDNSVDYDSNKRNYDNRTNLNKKQEFYDKSSVPTNFKKYDDQDSDRYSDMRKGNRSNREVSYQNQNMPSGRYNDITESGRYAQSSNNKYSSEPRKRQYNDRHSSSEYDRRSIAMSRKDNYQLNRDFPDHKSSIVNDQRLTCTLNDSMSTENSYHNRKPSNREDYQSGSQFPRRSVDGYDVNKFDNNRPRDNIDKRNFDYRKSVSDRDRQQFYNNRYDDFKNQRKKYNPDNDDFKYSEKRSNYNYANDNRQKNFSEKNTV